MEVFVAQTLPFTVAIEEDKFVIHADRSLFDAESLTKFLEYLRIKSLRGRSQASEHEIDELARAVNQAIWRQLKPTVLDDSSSTPNI